MFLTIQHTYETIEAGLFNEQHTTCFDYITVSKTSASKELVPLLKKLLSSHNLFLNDLSFIAVNKGPGPFTTLRVVISTINALAFAIQIPLIEVDGLHTFLKEYADPAWPITIALLNAFNQDVYFAIESPTLTESGIKKAALLFEDLKIWFGDQKIHCIGNGVELFHQELIKFKNVYIQDNNPQHPSLNAIAQQGIEQWQKHETVSQIQPAYLKMTI